MISKTIELGGNKKLSVSLQLKYLNRHGLITGATGSGKTVSLQLIVEQLSRAGVPVFAPDVKGDLIGVSMSGKASPEILQLLSEKNLKEPSWKACPVRLWSIGEHQNATRMFAKVLTVGPLLISRLLNLSEVQTSVMQIAFRISREQNQPISTLSDLLALFAWMSANRETLSPTYGSFQDTTISTIQRALVILEEQHGGHFFSDSELRLEDLMRIEDNEGVVNLLEAKSLLRHPTLYAVAFSWLLERLYNELDEVGDLDKPKLVIFIDEAHLLFESLGKSLQDNLERCVRLIRSKGVSVVFVSQLPSDIPEDVLGQLGNRIQHVLRAYTPKDQKAVRVAAQTMRSNPNLNIESAITELSPGEALVSVLQEDGTPSLTQRVWINMPGSQIGIKDSVSLLPPINVSASEFELKKKPIEKPLKSSQAEKTPSASKPEHIVNNENGPMSIPDSITFGVTVTTMWLLKIFKRK